jgi:hypothetical protein
MSDPFPLDAPGRDKTRIRMRYQALDEAERVAARFGRSMKCNGDGMAVQHADVRGGCANTGASCICECHDPKENHG